MNDRARRELDAATIVMAAVAGEATAEELTQLNDWLCADRELATFVAELIEQESWLAWHAGNAAGDHLPADVQQILAAAGATNSGRPLSHPEVPRGVRHVDLRPDVSADLDVTMAHGPTDRRSSASWMTAAALFIATGAVLGSLVTRWTDSGRHNDLLALAPDAASAEVHYIARFVHGAGCLWNSETTNTFVADEQLRTGESLNLLEGVAEFQLDWTDGDAQVTLEGPAGLVLTAERGASLSRGRITADINLANGNLANGNIANGAFVLGTPNGQIEISADASIGVSAHGENVELHVFRGAATFLAPWPEASETNERAANDRVTIAAGESITVASDADGRMQLHQSAARPEEFASRISMQSDDLVISRDYVKEILAGKPLLYWRFEDDDPALVRNETGDDQFDGRVEGAINRPKQSDNADVELGDGLTDESLHAYVISDKPLVADFSHGYSIEMWIKPSHYHWGTITSFIGAPAQENAPSAHGMLLELGGPITYPSSIEQPGRLRFLHRSPPSDDLTQGTSCFSDAPYELRKWQHVAAVKDGAEMRLYVDGKLVASGADSTPLPAGLSLIIGQLDQWRSDRRFVGQLDELAVYARPLTAAEIARRHELTRPRPAPLALRRSI